MTALAAPAAVERLESICRSILAGRRRPDLRTATADRLLPGNDLLAAIAAGPLADLLPAAGDPLGYPGAVEGPDPWFRDLGCFAAASTGRASLTAAELGRGSSLLEPGVTLFPAGGGLLPVCLRLFVTLSPDGPALVGRYLYACEYTEIGYEGHDHRARPATEADLAWFADAAAGFLAPSRAA